MVEHKTTADHWIPTFQVIFYNTQSNTTSKHTQTYRYTQTTHPWNVLLCVMQWNYYIVHGLDWGNTIMRWFVQQACSSFACHSFSVHEHIFLCLRYGPTMPLPPSLPPSLHWHTSGIHSMYLSTSKHIMRLYQRRGKSPRFYNPGNKCHTILL